jgi:TP901 family phage tail tape measure protein
LGQLDLTKFKQQLIESNKTMVQMRANLAGAGSMGTDSFNKVASSILNTNTQLKQTSTLLEKMSLTMANTIRFGISSSIFNNFTGSIQKAYDYVKKLDKSLNDIRIVSNASAADMERFAKYANTAAQNLGATTLDYTKAALIYFQQGLDEEQVKLRSDITVKMSNVLGESAEQVSDYMTAIWNNFAEGSENLEYYADVLAKLGAETASSAEEISQGLEKFSSVADTVGLSYEYAAAALTTVTDRTRQSADVVGTAFKTLFARIQDLELGDEGSVTIGKYSEALEKFDIHVLDSQGNLKKMDDILNEMGTKWHTMSEAQKVALAQNVAGVRQYTQLMSLMEN